MTWDTLIFRKQAKQNFTFFYSDLGQYKVGHQARNFFWSLTYGDILGNLLFFPKKKVNIAYENVKLQIFEVRKLLQIFNVVTI